MIHFGRVLAVGAEAEAATYETITGTERCALGLGPAIHFGGG